MTDFIAALEEQLVAAHRARRRRRLAVPWRDAAMLVASAAAVAGIVALVVALASPHQHRAGSQRVVAPEGVTTEPRTHGVPPATVPAQPPTATAVPDARPRVTTVAVLNGTTVTGLARAAADRLTRAGFDEGVVTNDTTNQQRQRSTVYYEPGWRGEAQAAARIAHIDLQRVRPMDANARVLVDRAPVAVFLGADAIP